MKKVIFTLVLTTPLIFFGQNPGGVNNSNANLQLWLKADVGISLSVDKVTQWNDQSGNNRHHSQTADARRPLYVNSGVNALYNFNPTVDFKRANTNRMETPSFHSSLTNSVYLFVVSRLNTESGYGGATWHTTYSFNGDCIHSHWFGINTRMRLTCAEDAGATLNQTFALNAYILPNGTTTSVPSPRVIWNGTPTDVTKRSYTMANNTYTIGCDRNNTDYMNGDIAEVIIYTGSAGNADINISDLQKIQSYLALKYGITLDTSFQPNYIDASGNNIWTGGSNIGYQNHIFGIGRDNASALHQKVSQSINDNSTLIISTSNDFTANNTTGRTNINNQTFLIVGDNNLSTAYRSFNYTGSIHSSTVNSIMDRVWKVQETGETGTIYLKNNNPYSTYLIVSNDPIFDDSDTWIPLDEHQSTPVNLINGQYFTFGGFSIAPGGELTGLELWLKADSGTNTKINNDPLTYWNDNSPNKNNHTQSTASNQPRYIEHDFNYNPSVYFDGSDAMITNSFANGQEAIHVFAMSKVNDNGWRSIYGFGRDATHVQWYNGGSVTKPSVWTGVNQYPISLALGINYGVTSHILPKDSQRVIHWNGTTGNIAGTNNYTYNSNKMGIGSDISNDGSSLSESMLGNIAEVIVYKTGIPATSGGPVNTSVIEKIQSYLAIKYGMTLSTNYKNSSGTTVFLNNLPYNNNIIGIAEDKITSLHQKQSKTISDSTRLYISTLSPLNSSNTGTFTSDKQYLVIGDDNKALRNTVIADLEKPAGILARLEREWKVTNTDFDGTFNIDLRLQDTINLRVIHLGELALLVDNDGNFSNADIYHTVHGITFSYSHPILTVSGIPTSIIPKNSTWFITIGRMDMIVPLSANLTLFEVVNINNRYVNLSWNTASEINNDYFTLERSSGDLVWQNIATINGGGNSSTLLKYKHNDYHPLTGISYYRIKQTDYDGNTNYSPMKTVFFETKNLTIYPNPTTKSITVEGEDINLETIYIFSPLGEEITYMIDVIQVNEKIMLDLSKLARGTYLVKVNGINNIICKQ